MYKREIWASIHYADKNRYADKIYFVLGNIIIIMLYTIKNNNYKFLKLFFFNN